VSRLTRPTVAALKKKKKFSLAARNLFLLFLLFETPYT